MWINNQSSLHDFILLGFSDRPWLETPFFVIFLVAYIFSLFGNISIILVSCLDPQLDSPMYFFVSNLSFLDLCYTTSTVPQMLVNLRGAEKIISYGGCVAQLYIFLALGSTESIFLAIMAFDRYAAICKPLHYPVIMNQRCCIHMAAGTWISGFANSVVQSTLTVVAPRCGQRVLDHFFCEVPALLKLACIDTGVNETELHVLGALLLLVPLTLILGTYVFIAQAVMRIRSAESRWKAFNTCASHLLVVSLFYFTAISMYVQPPSSYSRDRGKIMALFYGIVTPTLNPFIYTLRNKDVKAALRRSLTKEFWVKTR
ncbi:LOW QUALITY PROTEIN: olfactory receptor 2B6-like [Rhinopithecus roxellana]|uniref:LOW QUALITY PROTEIN: olfactory receptor 2B6-like n=1 Tax=Rhinopithecus roxellana TaxID=61622 RepID=UPI0012371CFC|nr:LOW QUALITY PROTEIN: olfactory receptor 2B6-like [Rhinopithecus roxellana]